MTTINYFTKLFESIIEEDWKDASGFTHDPEGFNRYMQSAPKGVLVIEKDVSAKYLKQSDSPRTLAELLEQSPMTQHFANDNPMRYKRTELYAMDPMRTKQSQLVNCFRCDKGHKSGKELHYITAGGLIACVNEDSKQYITTLFSRPPQINRYYQRFGKSASGTQMKGGQWFMQHLWNDDKTLPNEDIDGRPLPKLESAKPKNLTMDSTPY